jgi:hypothetical protein
MTLYNALNRAAILLGQSARRREAEARDAASSQAAVDLRLSAGHDREAATLLGEHLEPCRWTQLAPFGNQCQTQCGVRYAYHISYKFCPACGRDVKVKPYK